MSNEKHISFGKAIEELKLGKKATRSGWNGKGMFIFYVPSNVYHASGNKLNTMAGIFLDDLVPYRDYLAMKTVQNNVVPWVASQTDILADDWIILNLLPIIETTQIFTDAEAEAQANG